MGPGIVIALMPTTVRCVIYDYGSIFHDTVHLLNYNSGRTLTKDFSGLIILSRGSDILSRLNKQQLEKLRATVLGSGNSMPICPSCQKYKSQRMRIQWAFDEFERVAKVRSILPSCDKCYRAFHVSQQQKQSDSTALSDTIKHIARVNDISKSEVISYLSFVRDEHVRRSNSDKNTSWSIDLSHLKDILGEEPILQNNDNAQEEDPILEFPLVLS